nr:nucleotidyltransferase domain-containing protein [candidate division Zixibacteria bacterium]
MPYKGTNRYQTFLKAGRTITDKISRLNGVVGILGTGSIGRRFGDRHSDLDLIVYANREHVKNIDRLVSIGWIEYKGISYDIVVRTYEKALKAKSPSAYWTQVMRWDRQNSQILYDSDNRIRDLLKSKLVYPDREQKKLMARYHREIHEYLVFFPDMWATRGSLYNVVDALGRAVQSIILWIYAKNKVFEPFISKWLFYHLEEKTIPEHIYLKTLTRVFSGRVRNLEDALRCRDELLNLCNRIGLNWEVYNLNEVSERCQKNWVKISPESHRLLTW